MRQTVAERQDGIWIIDSEGKTAYANDTMAEILGTTTAEIRGKDSFFFIFPEDLAEARRLFESKQAGSSAAFHFKLRREDGTHVWVDVQGTPMRNASGNFTGVLGTFSVSEKQDF